MSPDSKVAPADPMRFADPLLIRQFGMDPITQKTQREILIATNNNVTSDPKEFFRTVYASSPFLCLRARTRTLSQASAEITSKT